MGDFNANVGEGKYENVVGPFGLGKRNDRGEDLINFCQELNLAIVNTWYEQKKSARHTWKGPDGEVKNQIDYILTNKRYRNSITNAKTRPGADCGSDHNPVVFKLRIKLKLTKKKKNSGKIIYNCEKLKNSEVKKIFENETNRVAKEIKEEMTVNTQIEEVWEKLKQGTKKAAENLRDKNNIKKHKSWMTDEILRRMEVRKQQKRKTKEYKEIQREVQRLCRQAKEEYIMEKCRKIEKLQEEKDPKLYTAIREMTAKEHKVQLGVKTKTGIMIREKEKIIERWKEYVEELYNDERGEKPIIEGDEMELKITEEEVRETIRKLAKNKASGVDGIPAELLQSMGGDCIEIIT